MIKNVNIVIVEDEAYNLRLLEETIKNLRPSWKVTATFESVKGTVEWLNNNPHPDLLFLDIQLADGLCFSIFEQVDLSSMVIFTTAYDRYAIRAFKVNSIDYLLKPFKDSELEASIRKFERFSKNIGSTLTRKDFKELLETIRKGEKNYRRRFLISKAAGYISLVADDVAYFYTENRITTAVTFDKKTHIVDFALDTLEEQLDPEVFYRANRQLVVNVKAVKRIDNHFGGKLKLQLNPQFEGDLLVSRLKAMSFRLWLGQ